MTGKELKEMLDDDMKVIVAKKKKKGGYTAYPQVVDFQQANVPIIGACNVIVFED